MKRRELLWFLGGAAIGWGTGQAGKSQAAVAGKLFDPLALPLPLPGESRSPAEQARHYATFTVRDDLVLPSGYRYTVLAAWGDRLGSSWFGYNCDYVGFFLRATTGRGASTAFLTVNFEYISPRPWREGYTQVLGRELPWAVLDPAVAAAGKDGLDWAGLASDDPLRTAIEVISRAALKDVGLGVMGIKQAWLGSPWERYPGQFDRRIDGLAGLDGGELLRSTGPAAAVFRQSRRRGYQDGRGDRIVGTLANCAGGTTPWGTVLSAEENFQNWVQETVYPDGSSFAPQQQRFNADEEEIYGCGSVLGLAGNKYGWMVEVNPANPEDPGTKHTWLGRFRHEAVALRVAAGQPLAVYSGCDRRGGHLYKFISQDPVKNPQDPANSRLFSEGVLYAAQFQPNGTGRWIPLVPETPIDPVLPSHCVGGAVNLPARPDGGSQRLTDDAAIAAFKQRFATLGDLYEGVGDDRAQQRTHLQGAILIDAHLAATAVGATCTARPEDTDLGPDGALFVAFTSGVSSRSDGGPDQRIFKGPQGETPFEYGWIMRIDEDRNDPAALGLRWKAIATGGEAFGGGSGFANPDNLTFDPEGNLWIVTDMSSNALNRPIAAGRRNAEGQPLSASKLRAVFGNNSLWCLPLKGDQAGRSLPFAYGPMDCELTGPVWVDNTLFLAVQHPGEVGGTRRDRAVKPVQIALQTTDGQEFVQARQVPVGSNWPSGQANQPPRPGVVAIYRPAFP